MTTYLKYEEPSQVDLIIISWLNTGSFSYYTDLKDDSFLKIPVQAVFFLTSILYLTACLFLWVLLFHTPVAHWVQLKFWLPLQNLPFKCHRVYCFSSVQEATKPRLDFLQICNPGLTLAFSSQLPYVSLVLLRRD